MTNRLSFRPAMGSPPRLARVAALALGLAACAAQPAWAAGAESPPDAVEAIEAVPLLNPVIELKSDVIRLGDIFRGAGRYADRPVASAPEPGESVTLEAAWLWRIANAYGVDWRPDGRHHTARATRLSTRVPAEVLAETVHAAVTRAWPGDPDLVELAFDNALMDLHLPQGSAPGVRLESWSLDARTGRFSATLVAPAEGPARRSIGLSGQAHRMALVPVPTRRVSRGDVLDEADLTWAKLRERALPLNALDEPEDLIGMEARRALQPGEPVRRGDVEAPILVERRQLVMLRLETATMVLTTQGKALEDGALGESVRVENPQSGRVIDGVVSGPGQVAIPLPRVLALR